MTPQAWNACVTCDVDLVDHQSGCLTLDELTRGVGALVDVCERHGCPVTWFFRLDGQMEALFGRADHVFHGYEALVRGLRARGDDIGWHPHAYRREREGWAQNVAVDEVVAELERYAPVARALGLDAVRMGWGFHTNETMQAIAALGFRIDSSAIPRPRYQWETSCKDWVTTPLTPYRPSRRDYRVPGEPALPLLEVPMSVMAVAAPYDRELVLRYCNLAFRPDLLAAPLEAWFARQTSLVTVMHPYEVLANRAANGLIAFDVRAVEQNLDAIERLAGACGTELRFLTLSVLAGALSEI